LKSDIKWAVILFLLCLPVLKLSRRAFPPHCRSVARFEWLDIYMRSKIRLDLNSRWI
jgi:hypothetical protein